MTHVPFLATEPRRVLLLMLWAVMLPGLLLGVQDGEEELENPSAKAVWKVDRVRGEEMVEYEVTIYQIPAPRGNRWVWRAIASDGSYPGGFPIGSMLILGSGKPRPELFDPLSPGVMEMLLSVHEAGNQGVGLGWADGTSVGLRRQIPVERTETERVQGDVAARYRRFPETGRMDGDPATGKRRYCDHREASAASRTPRGRADRGRGIEASSGRLRVPALCRACVAGHR